MNLTLKLKLTVKNFNKLNSKKTKGFSSVLFIFLLPLVLTIILTCSSLLFLHKLKSVTQFKCQNQLLLTQKGAQKSLELLFLLNPEAYRLEAKRTQTIIQLAIATSSYNYPYAAKLSAELVDIIQKQVKLSQKQDRIISTANAFIKTSGQISTLKVIEAWQELREINNDFIKVYLISTNYYPTELAIQKKWPGIAPAYTEKDRFSDKQKIKNRFTYLVTVNNPFIKSEYSLLTLNISSECGASLFKENLGWHAGIKEDRF